MELENVTGIGPKTQVLLNKLGIMTKEDLLTFYPFRYDILKRSDLKSLENGSKIIIDGLVDGQPMLIYLNGGHKKIIFRVNTRNSIINVTVYNQVYLYNELKYGKEVTIIGKYDRIKNTIIASEIRFEKLPENAKIEPIYHTTNGLKSKTIAKLVNNAIDDGIELNSMLPKYIIDKYYFEDYEKIIKNIHNPDDILTLKRARRQIKYEELFSYLLKIAYMKIKTRNNENAIERKIDSARINKFISNLPFELTEDQIIAKDEIISDMSLKKKMNRLLQGDVGSGKTIVAFIAIYANYLSKYQSALMAPTEILATQHYNDAIKIFSKYKIKIELLTSSTSKTKKEKILNDLKEGNIDFIIGTHSLIQDNVVFNKLGLVITDEQHRFGVNQRENLASKSYSLDVLSMSATPIPRTYALTIYGDMDISNIMTKPVGRKEVITYFKQEKEITEVLNMMKIELEKGHQIYVIAPSIDNDDEIKTSVVQMEKNMNSAFSKLYKIGSVHGKMNVDEKNKVMKDFSNKKIDILISTTVIEVGVNVANASMIVIFNANMFGLSTLHQLRGRVGRSNIQSYCILVAKESYKRLEMLEGCNDGFAISEYDFENRGEGDLFGSRQSGEMKFKLASFNKDYKLMLKAKEDADEFIDKVLNDDNYSDILSELRKVDNLG